MDQAWTSGNRVALLENGEEFFPRVFDAIANAQREVLIETFILYEDKVGLALHEAMLKAARRGARVDITVDAFGSPDLSPQFIRTLTEAGVRIRSFDPAHQLFRRVNYFRRLHRKLVVVDDRIAFVGGINYSADHLRDFGPESKQDYAVEVEGPIVDQICDFMRSQIAPPKRSWHWGRKPAAASQARSVKAGHADAMFVWRDNDRHRNDIENKYRLGIRLARQRIVIANAYFFPGYKLLRELRAAAKRGVRVELILQGNPDMAIVQTAASMLYEHLLQAGVVIHEFCERPLHGKVALIDDEWATVGSSNLDPLSLSLNLEANLIIRDREFNRILDQRLEHLRTGCKRIEAKDLRTIPLWRGVRSFIVFHVLRHYPSWAGLFPGHQPRLEPLASPAASVDAGSTDKATCR